MLAHRSWLPPLALAASAIIVTAIIVTAPPAVARDFDGRWSMVARTTSGHCGTIPVAFGIKGGRFYATGGAFAS
jgi:hypothetical protein